LRAAGVAVQRIVGKVSERGGNTGAATNNVATDDAVRLIESGDIHFVVNTPQARGTHRDGEAIRKAANVNGVALVTTLRAARAAARGVRERAERAMTIRSLQEYHGRS
jgi:4-hydroxyphenylpyruvate dioxygenase-like putative hemolysin